MNATTPRRTRPFRAVHLALLALAAALPAGAAEVVPVGSEIQVNTIVAGFQAAPAAALGPSGRHAVAWQGPGEGLDVWVQAWEGDGTVLVPEMRVNSHLPGCQRAPAVSFAPDGGFVVAWESEGQDGDGWGVFAQRFAPDGTLQGGELQVHATTAGDQRSPAVTHGPDDSFTLAWESEGQDGDGWGVYARRFDAAGALGGEVQAAASGSGDQRRPALAVQPTGHLILAWEGPDGSGPGIFLRRFAADLSAPEAEVRANAATAGFQSGPSIAVDGSGNVIAVWEGAESLQGRRLDRFLEPVSGDLEIAAAGLPLRARVGSAGFGDFLVAWESWTGDAGGPGVFARQLDFLEQPVAAELQVTAFLSGPQRRAALAASPAGDFLVAWESEGQDGDGSGVFARRYLLPGLDFHTVTPCRLFDTRESTPLDTGAERAFPIAGSCGIPATARAVSVNLTALDATGNGNLALFPGDAPLATVSSINFTPALVRANNAIVPLARNGAGAVTARAFVNASPGQVHLILDVNGYFE